MNEHEHNYPTHDVEFKMIIHALKMWRHYLFGKRFVLMIDHIGLRYLFDQPNLNSRKARWLAPLVSSILGSGISKVKRTGWKMLSTGGCR